MGNEVRRTGEGVAGQHRQEGVATEHPGDQAGAEPDLEGAEVVDQVLAVRRERRDDQVERVRRDHRP